MKIINLYIETALFSTCKNEFLHCFTAFIVLLTEDIIYINMEKKKTSSSYKSLHASPTAAKKIEKKSISTKFIAEKLPNRLLAIPKTSNLSKSVHLPPCPYDIKNYLTKKPKEDKIVFND